MSNARGTELAKIHIGKSQLQLSDKDYRDMLWTLCRVRSSAALDEFGRQQIISHLLSLGAVFVSKKPPVKKAAGSITAAEIKKIHALWAALAAAGVVKDGRTTALRKWVKASSRRYHQHGLGFEAPEFLDADAARGVIEQLKSWCNRTNVEIIR